MRERMVDWSRYNGRTNLKAAVDAFGIVGLMARCTIGHSYVDPYYYHNFQQARDLGILFGAYHVLRPQERAPFREVEWFKTYMTLAGEPPDFIVGDCELPNKVADWKLITPKEAGQVIVTTLPMMRDRIGLPTFCYTGSWWWNGADHLGPATPLGIEDDFMLIEGEYTTLSIDRGKVKFSQAPEPPKRPTIGRGWTQETLLSWQWTDGLEGIGCGPDGNKYQDGQVLMPTYKELLVILGKQSPPMPDKAKLDRLWEHHPELHSIL
jgi:hypothetical protein